MRVAIIGSGRAGRALATGLRGTGHAVVLGSRNAANAPPADAPIRPWAEAVEGSDLVILALPWAALNAQALAGLELAGRIVVDCTNPIGPGPNGPSLVLGHETSGAEALAGWLPGARLVKTLNQVGAEVMALARSLPLRPAMFLSGDDAEAKAAVARLLADLGFEALDAGPLVTARLLEPLAMVWINQSVMQGMGRGWALSILRTQDAAR